MRKTIRPLLIIAILLWTTVGVLAFTRQWRDDFSGGMGGWDRYMIGSCGGQNHYTSGGQLHMRASYGADCFGAYYRENNGHPGTFPTTEDVRVMWRWRYLDYELYGTQAGQLTGRYGWPQYYGMSGVNTGGSTNDAHALSEGPWGSYQVDNPLWRSRTTSWHVSTFDWLCDGVNMRWYMDGSLIHQENNSAYYFPPGHESRPYQFWMGNLLTSVPSNGDWTPFDLDYVYVYAVQRPQMNTPTPGSAGVQTVTWNTVPNTTQPDGSTWSIQYQVRACNNASCSNVQSTSPWQSGASYTFTGLPLQRTYTYQARARWVGTPALTTCWGNTVSAEMSGEPELSLSKTATPQQDPGDVVQYSLTLANTGDAPAYGVVIRDPIPGYITNPANITGGGSVAGNEVQWNIGTLNNGASVTVGWQGTIDLNIPRGVSRITNVATATDNAGHSDTAQASTTVLLPDMSLSKSATTPVWPGRDIDFSIDVGSTGQGTLRNIVITDPIPPYVIDPRNISDGGAVVGSNIVWNLGNMNPGATNNLSWRGTIDQASIPSSQTQIVNTVSGLASTGVNKTAQSSSQVIFPHMTLAKSGPATMWPTGSYGSFVYTMTVTNDGAAIMVSPVITDPFPHTYMINVTNINNGGVITGNAIAGNGITWHLSDMDPGDSVELSYEFGISPLLPESVTEQTNIIYGTADWWEIDERAQHVAQVGRPNMRLTKIAPTTTWPNAPISYTILVENTGNAPMYGVVITDAIPHYVTNLSGISHNGQIEGDHIVWHLPDPVPENGRVVLTWHGLIDANIPQYETQIINEVQGKAMITQDSTEAGSVLVYPAMLLGKSAPPRSSPGERIEFVITVQNTGQAPMYDVRINDPIPDYVTNPDAPTGNIVGNNVVWEFPEMAPGETQSLIWSGLIDDNIPDDITTLVNKVYGTAMSGISEYAETTTVMLYPTMSLGKWATPEVWPGGLIEYRITVQNTGAAEMEVVEIRDFIPDYVLNVTNISHGGTIDGQEIVWDLGDMAPGASFELTWEGTVDPFIPKSRNLIRNQVQGQAARGVSDVAEATSLVLFPSLVINKTGTEEAAPGDTVQFIIEVHNASAAPVEDVVVKDFIPDYINDPANISYNGYVEGKEIIWEIGSLAGGESFALAWEGTIDLSVPLGQKYLDNLAEICDGLERYCDNALYRLRLLQAEARVIKNATPYGWPGSDVEYTIQVLNTGETDLQEVVITDPLPTYIQYPREISHGGTAIESPFEGEIAVVWHLGDLAIGELVELSWQGTVAKDTPVKVDAIENIATLTTKRGLERQGFGSTYIMHPALRLIKRASETAGPGDTIDYTITLENPSWIPVYEVEVHDIIPTYILTPTNVSGGGETWADEIYWHFETVAPGQVITLTWQGTVDPEIPAEEEEIRNTVRAADMTGVEAEAEAITDLVRQDIVVRKSATYAVQPGHEVAYTIEIENRSGAEISGIIARDAIPAYVLDPRHISGGGEVRGNTEIVWEIASLAAGEILSFAWTGTVDPAIPADEPVIWNEVTASSESGLEASTRARSFVDQPLLSVDKTATLNAGPNETITYTIVVENLGRGPAYDVEVHDPLPAHLHDPVILTGDDGVIQADEVSWLLDGELAAGEVVTLTWSATVDRLVPPDVTEIVNTVNIFDGAGNTSQDQAVTDLLRQQVYLAKEATYLVYPGSSVVYTITLENRGEAVLYDVTVTDPVPKYVLNPANISGGGSHDGNETILWEIAALRPGQAVTMTWAGTVDTNIPLDEQVIWNEATVVTGSGLEAVARARSLVRHPLLTVSKSATNEAGPGDMVDYLVTIKNMGLAPAYDVELHDPIPAYIVGATSGDATEVRADEVYGYFDVLPPGAERVLQWSGQVDELIPPDQTRVVNVVTVQDSSGNMDEAEAVTTLRRQAVFIDKTASREVYPGGPVVYTMTLQNRGETTLYGLIVADPIPQYVQEPTAISSGGEERGNTHIVWEMPALAVGEVVTMTWSGTVAKDIPASVLSIWNEVKVSTGSGLETTAQAKSVVKQPQLVVAKRATNEAGPGEPVDYSLMIANTGPAPAYDVEVMDPIPAYIVSPGGAVDGQIWADQIYWYFDVLPPGETRTLAWNGFVDPAVPETELSIVNTAMIQDAAGHTDEAEATTNLPGQAVTVKKDATYMVYPGGDVVYTVTVHNPGAATLYDITVTDPVPTNILAPRDITGGGWLAGNTQIVWEIPALPGGDELVLTWRGAVDRRIPSREQVIWNEVQVVAGSGPAASARAKSWVEHPLLVVEKTATNEAGPGEPVDYAIIVKNTGAGPAYEIEVMDPIPAYITHPGGAAGGQIRADEVYWYLDSLQPGESRALSWNGFVDPAIPETELSIVNTVTAQDGAGNTDEARASTNILAQELAVFKNATYMVYPGGDVVYTVTVRNRGTSALYDVLVTDPVPAYVLNPRDITSGGRFDGNTNIIWEIPALAGGQSLDVVWRGTVDPDIPGKEQAIWNQVSVTTAGGLEANAQARSLVRYPSLTVDKSATRQTGPGQTVVYTITVQNLGQSPAHTIEVFDPIPAHIVAPTSADATEIRAEEVYWHLDMLAPGESRTLSWAGLVDPAVPATKAAIVNRVTVQDGSGHTAEAEASTTLPAQAVDVHQDASYLVYPGGDVVYTVTVRNSGAATLYDVTVTDPVPTYVLNPRAISDGGHFDGNTAVVWQLAAMAPGERVTLTWTGMVDIEIPAREQSVWNEVNVTTAGGLTASAKAKSLVQRPVLSVAKSATAAAGPGETVVYTLTIRNSGQAPAYGIEIHDPIPAYILNAASGSTTEVRADEVYWQFDTLQPGETHTLTWRGNIDPNIPETIPGIVNNVTVQDAAGQTDEAQAMTNLRLQRVDMVKSGTYALHPGGDVVYTITVRNPGNTTLSDIVVTDPLPAYVLDPRDITAGGELRGNTEVVWEMATLAAGQEIELAWVGTVDPRIPDKQLSITNEATLVTGSGLAASARARSLVYHPTLTINKTATLEAGPGDAVHYTITINNPGQAPAYEVEVLDPIPDHLGQIIASTGGVIQADAVYWRFAEIIPGQVISMTWTAIVDKQLPADADVIINEVTVQDITGQVEADQASTDLLAQRLGLVKTGSAIIEPGGDVNYTITVRNLGGADLYDITVTDPVPEYILAPRDISAGGELKGNTEVGWEIATLAAGQEAVLTWVGTLDPGVPADESEVWNDVSATTGSGLEAGARARSKILRPVLMMTKLAPFAAGPGEMITYTIIIENAGQVPAHEVVVHDPIPAGIRQPSVASGGFIDYLPTYEAQWRLGEMQPGTRRTLIWTGKIDPRIELEPGGTRSINNSATALDSSGTGVEAAVKTIVLQPQVDLAKLATRAAGPGEPVDYTVIVSNTGETTLYGLLVTDPVPEYIVNPTHISHSGVLSDGQVIWSLGRSGLPAGETLSLTWSGTVDLNVPRDVGHIRNRAGLTAFPNLSNSAESVTQILRPAVEISKAAPDEIEAGDMITYTLTVTNTGPVTLFETTITDSYPDVISPTTMSDNGTVSGSDIVWSLGHLAAGEVVQLNWSGLVDPALPVTAVEVKNTVVVTALAGVAAETAVTTTVRQPVLQIAKIVTGAAKPGGRLQYRLEISNTGQAGARGVRIEDILPDYVIPQSIENHGYEIPGRIIWALDDLAAGDMETVSWQGVVDPDIPAGESQIINRAIVSSLGGLNAEARVVSDLLRPSLSLGKRVESGPAYPGGRIEYALQLINNGDSPARNIEVNDPLPDYVAYVPDSVTNYGTYTAGSRTVTWYFDILQPGDSVEMSWQGQVDLNIPAGVRVITNAAEALTPDVTVPVTAAVTTELIEPEVSIAVLCPEQAQGGDVLSYTIRLHNTGGTLPAPALVLPLPADTGYQVGSASHSGQLETGRQVAWGDPLGEQLVWELETLAHNDREQIRFALAVSPGATGHVDTVASLASANGTEIVHGGCQTTLFEPVLVITKTAPAQALVNDIVEYRIAVENTGVVVAHHTMITDNIRPGVNYIPGSASGDVRRVTTVEGDDTWEKVMLVWNIGDLQPGEKVSHSFKGQMYVPLSLEDYPVTFSDDGKAEVYNEATATADRATAVFAEVTTLVPQPGLNLKREVTVETDGVVVSYGTLDTGVSPNAGPLAQPLAVDLSSSDDILDTQDSSLAAGSAVQAWPGSEIEHTLIGVNNGPGVARQVVLTESVPEGLTVLEGTISDHGYYDPDQHAIIWAIGDMAEGEQVTRSYTLLVPLSMRPGSQAIDNNKARLTSPDAPTAYAGSATELAGTFEVVAVKLATDTVEPGETIDYIIRVQNISPNPVDQVTILDMLPGYTAYITGSASVPPELVGGLARGRLKWNLGMLMPGEIRDVHFQAQVAAAVPNTIFQIQNEAEITFSGGQTSASAVTKLPVPPPDDPGIIPTATPVDNGDENDGHDDDGGDVVPPPVTAVPPRSTAVVPPFGAITPTARAGSPVPPTPTPRPQPGLSLSVLPATVNAGEVSLVTWRLTFSNPTPLEIGDLVVRDLLPPGLLVVGTETSRGVVEVSTRSMGGRGLPLPLMTATGSPTPTVEPTATGVPTSISTPVGASTPTSQSDNNAFTAEEASLVIRSGTGETVNSIDVITDSDVLPAPTSTVRVQNTNVITGSDGPAPTTPTPTATVMVQETVVISGEGGQIMLPASYLKALPGVDDVPLTEVVFHIGNLAPGGRVQMVIDTLVLSDTAAGSEFDNIGTYAAANMDPGTSNHAIVKVIGARRSPILAILPVTGGLLAYVDPRTTPGQVTWLIGLGLIAGLLLHRKIRRGG